jgi:hypothetical protein
MQLSKYIKLTAAITVVSCTLSTTVQAATASYAVGFTTVPDVSIVQLVAMDFGTGLLLSAGATCTMTNGTTEGSADFIGNTAMRLADATATLAPAGSNAVLSGTACTGGGSGTVGLYEVSGAAGALVQVSVNSITGGTNFNFTPAGCISSYDGNSDGDTCATITPKTDVQVQTAAAADQLTNTGTPGAPAVGKTYIAVGGDLIVSTTLSAGTTYTEQFTIDVTY